MVALLRTFAVWQAARYETRRHHIIHLSILLSGSLVFALLIVYCIYVSELHFFLFMRNVEIITKNVAVDISDKMIFVFFGVEGFTFLVRMMIYEINKLNHRYQSSLLFTLVTSFAKYRTIMIDSKPSIR